MSMGMLSASEMQTERVSVEVEFGPQDVGRFIDAWVNDLDLDALGFRRRRQRNRSAPYPLEALLKVVLYGWATATRSLRALEEACQYDVRFVALTRSRPPSRATLQRFFADNYERFPALFSRLVVQAAEAGLIKGEVQAVDGTKMLAAASMHTALHLKGLKKSSNARTLRCKLIARPSPAASSRPPLRLASVSNSSSDSSSGG